MPRFIGGPGSGPDLASQVCILHEAGGRFSDLDDNPNIDAEVHVLSNGHLHDEVLKVVRTAISERSLDPTQRPDEDTPVLRAARAAHGLEPWRPRKVTPPT